MAEYMIDMNATQAAIRAGYSEKTAYAIGEENLKKPEIAAKLPDLETHSRVKAMSQTPEAVKRALVELIMIDARNAEVLGGSVAVKSFSTDGYSETVEAMTADKIDSLRGSVLYDFLAEETDDNGTPLLYMGVEI